MPLAATAAVNGEGWADVKGNDNPGGTEKLNYSWLIRDETETKIFRGTDDLLRDRSGGSVRKVASAKSTHAWDPLTIADDLFRPIPASSHT